MKSTVKIAKTIDLAVKQAIKELGCTEKEAIVEILEEPKTGFFGLLGSKDAVVKVSCEENIEELLNDVVSGKYDEVDNIVEEAIIEKEIIIEEKQEKEIIEKKAEIKEPETKKTEKKVNKVKENIEEKEIEIVEEDNSIREIPEELIDKTREFLKEVVEKMGIKAYIETYKVEGNLKFNIIPEDERDIGIVIGKRGETLDAIQYIVNLVANRNSKEYLRISVDSNNYREKRIESLESLAHKMAKKVKRYNRNMKLEPMNPYERRIIHSTLQNVQGIYTISEGEEPYRKVVIKIKKKNK